MDLQLLKSYLVKKNHNLKYKFKLQNFQMKILILLKMKFQQFKMNLKFKILKRIKLKKIIII